MVDSIHVLLERLLLLVVCFVVPSIAVLLYLSGQKTDFAIRVTEEYLESVSVNGVIERDEYEQFLTELARVSECTVELSYDIYSKEPYYGYYSMGEIVEHYKKRNIRTEYPVSSTQPDVSVEDIDKLFLQDKNNVSVLAGLVGDMSFMIPVEGVADSYMVVIPEQEVYVGEPLVTVLLQSKDGVTFYRLADDVFATGSGTYAVPLSINGESTGESIQVTAWDKLATCERGHEYPSTKEVIEHYKSTGKWELCPYCHAYIDNVTLSAATCEVPLGTVAESVPVMVHVTYMDGHEDNLSLADVSHNYDPQYEGEQLIEVSFGGITKEVGTITTVAPACSQCGGVISDRCYGDCIKETRCAACLQSIPIYLGETFSVRNTIGHEYITEVLLSEGEYKLGRGNYLELSVYKRGKKRTPMEIDVFFRTGKTIQRSRR